MDIPNPTKHGGLVFGQLPIPEAPSMNPNLLPVKVPYFQHPMLGKEWVSMVQSMPALYQTRKPLLIPEQRPPLGHITRPLEVPPHHEAVLEVREDKSII